MASQKHPTTIDNLPCDVLSNIFIRLLAKQLAQMRSVSKSMNALLSNKSLIKSHLHHSLHNNDEIILLFHDDFDYFDEPFFAHSSRSPNLKLTDFIKLPVNFQWKGACVIGSVNGLLCLKHHSFLYIWNPSLSAFLTLPPHSVPSPATGNGQITINFRFGFDPKADDYKVVKLPSVCGPPSFQEEWLQVEVYSMKIGSWKPITQRFPSHFTDISSPYEVCVAGHDDRLHWIGYIGKEITIVALNLTAETFHEIPLPETRQHYNWCDPVYYLGVLAGKLCVMSCPWIIDGDCELWVMEEYGVVESWVKHHVFSQFRNIYPRGITLHNLFLFEKNGW